MSLCYKFKTILKTRCLKGGEGRGNEPPSYKSLQGKLGISSGSFSLPAVSNLVSKLIFELAGVCSFLGIYRASVKGLLSVVF